MFNNLKYKSDTIKPILIFSLIIATIVFPFLYYNISETKLISDEIDVNNASIEFTSRINNVKFNFLDVYLNIVEESNQIKNIYSLKQLAITKQLNLSNNNRTIDIVFTDSDLFADNDLKILFYNFQDEYNNLELEVEIGNSIYSISNFNNYQLLDTNKYQQLLVYLERRENINQNNSIIFLPFQINLETIDTLISNENYTSASFFVSNYIEPQFIQDVESIEELNNMVLHLNNEILNIWNTIYFQNPNEFRTPLLYNIHDMYDTITNPIWNYFEFAITTIIFLEIMSIILINTHIVNRYNYYKLMYYRGHSIKKVRNKLLKEYTVYPLVIQLMLFIFTLTSINSFLRPLLIAIVLPWIIMQVLFCLWLTFRNVRFLSIQVMNLQSIKPSSMKLGNIKVYKLLLVYSFVLLINSIIDFSDQVDDINNIYRDINYLNQVVRISNYVRLFIDFLVILLGVLIFWILEVKLMKITKKDKISKYRDFNIWCRVGQKKFVLLLLMIFISYNVIYPNLQNYGRLENILITDNTDFSIDFNNIPVDEIYNYNLDKLVELPEIKGISESIHFSVNIESQNYQIPIEIMLVNNTLLQPFECGNCEIKNISEIIPQDKFFTSNIVYDSFVGENIILTTPHNVTKVISQENIEIIQPKNGFIPLIYSLASTITYWNSLELNYPILRDGSFVSGEDLSDQFVSDENPTGSKIAIYWSIIVNDEFSNLNENDIQSLLSKHLDVETIKLNVFDRLKSREQSARINRLTYVSNSNVSLGVIIFLISFFLIINTKEYYQKMSLLYTKYGIHKIIKKQLISMNLVIFSFILLSMCLSTFIGYITVVNKVFNIYFYQGLIISSDIYIVYTLKYLSIIIAVYLPLSVLSNILFYKRLKKRY